MSVTGVGCYRRKCRSSRCSVAVCRVQRYGERICCAVRGSGLDVKGDIIKFVRAVSGCECLGMICISRKRGSVSLLCVTGEGIFNRSDRVTGHLFFVCIIISEYGRHCDIRAEISIRQRVGTTGCFRNVFRVGSRFVILTNPLIGPVRRRETVAVCYVRGVCGEGLSVGRVPRYRRFDRLMLGWGE